MTHCVFTGRQAERRAANDRRPLALSRHGQSAGTVQVRLQFTKPARIPSGDRPMYTSDEGHHQRTMVSTASGVL